MLHTIPISVTGQNLLCDSIRVASDLIAEVRCDFTLSAEWAEFQTVSAIFEDKYGKRIETVISDGSCLVPHEVLQHRGTVKVNLCGYKLTGETKTLQMTSFKTVIIDVLQSVNTSGDNSTEPTAPTWQQQLALRPTDAPSDGKQYARKDGEWEEVDDATDWDSITGKPSTYPPSTHSHSYDSITNKPDTFPPSAHEHTVADISDFPSIPTDNIELANGAGYITSAALEPTKRSLDALWKLSKGQLWDIEQVECEGHAQLPSGGEYGSIDEVRGKTEQETTNGYQIIKPSVLTEQTINGVTFTPLSNGGIKMHGTATARAEFYIHRSGENYEIPAGSYYNCTDAYIIIKCVSGYKPSVGRGLIFTSNNGETIETVYLRVESGETIDKTVFPMISTKQDATYEPYTGGIPSPNPDYPQEIRSVEEINIKKTGKNLVKRVNEIYFNSSGSIASDGECETAVFYAHKGLTYVRSSSVAMTRNSIAYLRNDNPQRGETVEEYISATGGHIFTAPKDGWVGWYCVPFASEEFRRTIQIEVGSTATDYEPYTEPITRTIIPPRPLNAIGEYKDKCNVVKGTLVDVVNGEWVYRVISKTFNGSESWRVDSAINPLMILPNAVASDEVPKYLPNTYKRCEIGVADVRQSTVQLGANIIENQTALRVRTAEILNGMSATDFCNYLNQHPLKFLYIPANEAVTTEPINESDLDFLRNLTLHEGENLFITDNHGRDVSYLMSDFINLGKVGG